MPLGAMLGCPVTAGLVDKLGRKNMMLMLTIPTLIGWAMIIWAESVSIKYILVFLKSNDAAIITNNKKLLFKGGMDLRRPTYNRIRFRFLFCNCALVHFWNSRKGNSWYFGHIFPVTSHWRNPVHLYRWIFCKSILYIYIPRRKFSCIIIYDILILFTVQRIRFDHFVCYNSNCIRVFDGFNTRKPDVPSNERKNWKSSFIFKIFPWTLWHSRPRTIHNAGLVSQGIKHNIFIYCKSDFDIKRARIYKQWTFSCRLKGKEFR